eukprot:7923362-Prorocentrum_lima.AAC.1
MGHPGEELLENARAFLTDLGRELCTTPGCGGLRPRQTRARQNQCRRCGKLTPTRPLCAGYR